jgi:O-antigen ligase
MQMAAPPAPARLASERREHGAASACLLLLPLALLYARAVAEALIASIDLLFLLRCARLRDWAWLRRPECALPLAYWMWLVLCSALGPAPGHAVPQAMACLRFWLLAAALGRWVLAGGATRRRLGWAITAAALWIGLECWQQYLTGVNLFGVPRWGDGALTGPFPGPRAGPAFVVLLPAALLPPVVGLLGRPGIAARLAGAALAAAGLVTLLLIGQRMPALLGLFGLCVSLLLLRRLRPAALAALGVAAVLLAALPVVSPPTWQKLVLHFLDQMAHFWQSPYGQIYVRAAAVALAHPLLGQGFDGYRLVCAAPAYAHAQARFGLPAIAGPDEGCNLHPHQFWLEAASSAGLPGLLLFAGAVGALWRALAIDLWRGQDATRVALFVTVLAWLWPLASTSGFYNLPIAGWGFLMAGWGLALRPRA